MGQSKHFFDTIRPLFGGKISQSQINGIEAIIAAWVGKGITNDKIIAYALATAFHETAKTMQPIEEYGKGANYAYGKKLKRGGGANKRIPYTIPDKLYYGRGHLQLTWYENYESMGKILGIDLLNHPELMLDASVSAKVMVRGMTHGDFTGHNIYEYFNDKVTDPFNARKVINGLDKAGLIQGYYNTFLKGLTE